MSEEILSENDREPWTNRLLLLLLLLLQGTSAA